MPDVHFLTYEAESMWSAMTTAYMDAGGEPLYPGNEKEMLLRGAMAIFMQTYAAFDTAARMQTLRYATGEYLDIIGEQRNIDRIPAYAASGEISLVVRPGASGLALPAGTLFTDGERTVQLADGITVPAGTANVTVTAGIVCTVAGTAGNAMMEGTELYPVQQEAAIISASVSVATRGGQDEEEDEPYRERIRTGGFYGATTGPAGAYESRAEAVSAGIADAKARRKAAGEVEVNLLFAAGITEAEKTAIIADVLLALNDADARPISDTVSAKEADVIPYALNIEYTADGDSAENMAIKLQEAANGYQAWQEGAVGRQFDPYRLLAALYNAGATRAEWDVESNLNGGAVAYTKMEAYQCLKGTITLSVLEESP